MVVIGVVVWVYKKKRGEKSNRVGVLPTRHRPGGGGKRSKAKAEKKQGAVSPSPASTGARGHGSASLEEHQNALREAEKKQDAALTVKRNAAATRIQSVARGNAVRKPRAYGVGEGVADAISIYSNV